MFRPDQPLDPTAAASRDMVGEKLRAGIAAKVETAFCQIRSARPFVHSFPDCLVDFVRPVENRKLVAPRAICQKWRLERKFLGGYSHGQFSSFSTEMEEDEDSLEFVPCCKLL